MIEILEKVSDQVKKVKKICSELVSALLSVPPNLLIFSGQEPVPRMEGSIDQLLFQVEGALATHTDEAVRSAVIGSVRGAAHELLEFIGYGEEMSVILKHIKNDLDKGLQRQNSKRSFSQWNKGKQKV